MSEQNTVNNDISLAQENAALRNKVTVLEEQLSLMQEQLAWLKKQVFGRKTEQTSVIMGNDTQLSFFPVNDDKNDPVADNTTTVTEHKRKKKRTHDDWMSRLPVEEVLHKEDDPKCEKCGSDMTEIGEDRTEFKLIMLMLIELMLTEIQYPIAMLKESKLLCFVVE